ncbi:uncharacterized protein TRIADDRAFT_59750 [Trichoplax adhaerens]|uniref:G-protein coupled receptors family 2 profile 2 domain-containing protein n=1 Tax=Trichoplax adhaerens TaxID=10228 RepID=B3S6B9_TRIAD|nr:hypothetical protein TRIADDRAFT_59750 [Trichoplax adhaerens]EDV21596.1 hypothetical protein TRIADDRAFT_59750 [Trichoplax adhaerens]|eukprot:XP_002115744.1 hypothetical protein TRIADDRAFT_59750 [Trichoplax adhaerens]
MSSVQLALFCCANSSLKTDDLINFYPFAYNGLCAGVSLISMFGALYTIFLGYRHQSNQSRSPENHGEIDQHSTTPYNSDIWERSAASSNQSATNNESYLNHRKIIYWLTIADFLAVSAVLIKSVLWMVLFRGYILEIPTQDGSSVGNLLCAILATVIRFFYTATFFWTLCYAVEVYRKIVRKDERNYLYYYQIFTWGLSTALVSASAITLYNPGLKRWVPNIIECFFVYTDAQDFKLVLWMVMGLVNPLQALLNAFVYRTDTHLVPVRRYRRVPFSDGEENSIIS